MIFFRGFISIVEKISKEPVVHISQKEKDPKKLSAGKKLAAYNIKAKENKKKLSSEAVPTNYDSDNSSKFDFSLTAVIAILGLVLSAVDLYFRYKNNEKDV